MSQWAVCSPAWRFLYHVIVNCKGPIRVKPAWGPRIFEVMLNRFLYFKVFFHNRPRSIYQYSNMAPTLSGQTSIFGVVFYLSKYHWELRDKSNLNDSQFWPKSLGAMLEYLYIEHGLFKGSYFLEIVVMKLLKEILLVLVFLATKLACKAFLYTYF